MSALVGPRASALAAGHPLGRAARVAFVGACGAALVALHAPLCPFALVTRRPCPGCGLVRATLALLSGDLGEAIHVHPLAPIVAPVVVAVFASSASGYVRRGRWGGVDTIRSPVVTGAAVVLAVALVAVWIARFFGLLGGPVAV